MRRSLLATLLAASVTSVTSHAAAQATEPVNAPHQRLMPLEVVVNTVTVGSWTLLERDGLLHAPDDALAEWRIEIPAAATPVLFRGSRWYPLDALPGFQARINQANQSLELVFSANAFIATRLADQPQKAPDLTPVEPALFLNLDTNLSLHRAKGAASSSDLGFLAEVGFASDWGVMTSSFLGRNLMDRVPGAPRSIRRLESTFTRDFREHNLTLRLGDSTTRYGLWGRAVYFGGIQVTRNFSLTPGLVTQAVPLITGASSAPSTVELYVNDALRQTSNVPAGPFVVQNFPSLTGAGEARMVVRDVLGRETVIVQPFFTDATLLAPGLSDWSVEAGAVRLRLGEENDSYGERFLSGTYRYGLSPASTIETRMEITPEMRNVGVGLTQGLFGRVLAQAAIAASSREAFGQGHEWVLGLSHNSLRHGFSVRAQGASPRYSQLGADDELVRRRREYSASYTFNSDRLGAFGVGVALLQNHGFEAVRTVSASYSTRVGSRSALTLAATRVTGAVDNTSFGATLTIPLENQITTAASFARRGDRTDAYATVDRGLSAETGTAWRVLAGGRNDRAFSEAGVRLYSEKSLLTAEVAASSGQQALRLGAQTGLVLVGGRFFATRRVQDSFALVQVPGYENVGVGIHGRTIAHTDADGFALLPRLIAYQPNSIQLNASDLPINAELDSIEMHAVPPARAGVKIVFPVRAGRGALLKIVFDDGEPAPAGAEVELHGDKEQFFVARRGESFVTGLQERNTVHLKWKGKTCTFAVRLPEGAADDIARVGPILCKGVER